MRICIDLDGVISQLKRPGETYADVAPMPGAVEKLRALRAAGHIIIICTARHMKTCNGNPGQVVARIGAITLDWLARHGVEYDEIHFGKPWADVYIDDNAMRFESWSTVSDDGTSLPRSTEATLAAAARNVP
jgi:capsule biosynthesis phosphatase